MSRTVHPLAVAGRAVSFPAPQSGESLTVHRLAEAHAGVYADRDN
jgi:hypothetical protein